MLNHTPVDGQTLVWQWHCWHGRCFICTLSAMTTLRHTECRFVFLLSILSFKWPMCNSQGNLTEPDDNFCAIGIVATTFFKYYLWRLFSDAHELCYLVFYWTNSFFNRLIEPLLSTLTILPSQDSHWYHNSDIISSHSTLLSKFNLIEQFQLWTARAGMCCT